MLSTDMMKESMMKRIEKVVSSLMEERPLFKEDLNYSEIVQNLVKIFEENLSLEEINTMSDQSLKNRCSGIMSLKVLAKIGEDFTPEQMAIFDEAIKRK
ncbi:hypothetical protein [Planktothrix mougeotii]|uniref:Nif11 domain-containing protein n=1 Tax=Planktothrix mougeotii LEGE 06226 TaxID=1828728 RepID=A0ABR9U952_9CYAN|nr:hypothetical protein [Planktothrix mougeotii]MBE9142977.1 hypothetical protein [Planktothrix mougeotii LEGE 06226]